MSAGNGLVSLTAACKLTRGREEEVGWRSVSLYLSASKSARFVLALNCKQLISAIKICTYLYRLLYAIYADQGKENNTQTLAIICSVESKPEIVFEARLLVASRISGSDSRPGAGHTEDTEAEE